ncbi:MAG: prepilin-type N-terminal cleavage/methylation domain-containing protein [Polyangiales bacterium]
MTAGGFTLVELMIVVVILGLLAAVALPSFSRYVRRSRTTEAVTNIQRIFAAQVTYNNEIHEGGLTSNFVNAPALPSTPPTSGKYPANVALWTGVLEWNELGFALEGAHFYQYASPGSTAGFTAYAYGDLDGDMVRSTFSRTGLAVSGEVQGAALSVAEELE